MHTPGNLPGNEFISPICDPWDGNIDQTIWVEKNRPFLGEIFFGWRYGEVSKHHHDDLLRLAAVPEAQLALPTSVATSPDFFFKKCPKIWEGFFSYSAEGPWNKSLNFIFPTRVMRKSLKVGHWLSEFLKKKLNSLTGPNLPKTGPNPNVGK